MTASPTPAADEQSIALRRMLAESDKFVAEQRKLMAEAAKLERDRSVVYLVAGTALFTSCAAFLGTFAAVLKLFGH